LLMVRGFINVSVIARSVLCDEAISYPSWGLLRAGFRYAAKKKCAATQPPALATT